MPSLDPTPPYSPLHRSICAVVVTHNTGHNALNVLEHIAQQVDYIIIVDNASTDTTLHHLKHFLGTHKDRCHIVEHTENNLAKAQNLGIHYACTHGYKWVLLMDHDSIPDEGMVEQMLMHYSRHAQPHRIGMVIPNIIEQGSSRTARYVRMRSRWRYARTAFESHPTFDDILLAIASGSLIPTSLFADIGAMNESLCIDNVDFDFSLRIIRSGKRILAVRNAHLLHRLGACHDHHLLGSTITTSNHHPTRRYYIYRNRLRLWRMHGTAFPCYVLFDVCAIAYDLFKIGCFEGDRIAKIKAIGHGIRDALRGRTGMIEVSRY